MKTIYRILLPALLICTALAAGCTEQFDMPPALVAATDDDITDEGYEIVSIKSVKKIFEAEYPDYNSSNTSFNKGVLIDEESLAKAGMDEGSLLAIKGRVISTDYFGNVYRTLYLLDESELPEGEEPEAIEVKIGLTGMFADYQPGDILYVKINGLVIGNYRFNLSLGSAFQALEGANEYANGYIDLKAEILDRVKRGTKNRDLPPLDTLVFKVGETGIFDVFGSDARSLDPAKAKAVAPIVGRLVRFEGMRSIPGTAEANTPGYSNSDIYPSFLEQKGTGTFAEYMNYIFDDVFQMWNAYDGAAKAYGEVTQDRDATEAYREAVADYEKAVNTYKSALANNANNGNRANVLSAYLAAMKAYLKVAEAYEAAPSGSEPAVLTQPLLPNPPRPGKMFPSWAFSNDKVSYYGSALFALGSSHFVVRSSGYSNFALEALPFEYETAEDGNMVFRSKNVESVTGIVTRYSSSSGGYHKFQILLNSSRDVVYDRSNNPR